MATTRVTRARLQAGDLPPICVVTGRPADGLVQATLVHTRSWPWALLPLAAVFPEWSGLVLVAMAVAFWTSTVRIPARLPMTDEALARHHVQRRVGARLLLVALVALGLAVVAAQTGWATVVGPLVGAGVLAAAAGFGVRRVVALRFVRAVPEPDGVHVTLRRVPAGVADAVADGLLAAR